MKQKITFKQWEKASVKVKSGWQKWCDKIKIPQVGISQGSNNCRPFINLLCPPSIGRMIEFITLEHLPYDVWETSDDEDFCDNLWKITKDKLENGDLLC